MRFRVYIPREPFFAVERVKEYPLQILHGVLRRINGNASTIDRAKSSEIVESHDVIRMRMGIKNGIQMPNIRAERLKPELCAGIYDPGAVRRLYVDRGPQPLITGIFGLANFARATNHGYTHGCASA
jgi:predicted oxidoreductase